MNVPPYTSCHCLFTTPNDIQFKCIIEGLLTLTVFSLIDRICELRINECFNEEDIVKLKTF